ncbi:MAG: SDR family NAD(P)-dependent oxidoreductase [Cyanobacteria bacterium HKST-UBA03]|nr:SDR family NAD(P)-dependent oxidoreductase [Cyanobacteria bacterium HKST-UBA03]
MTDISTPRPAVQTDLTGKTILVTGGAGFIGSHVVAALLAQGARVINIDNFNDFYDPAIKRANVLPFLQVPDGRYEQYEVNLCDEAAMQDVFEHHGRTIDRVVHLAAWAGVRPSMQYPVRYHHANVTGTTLLLELMKAHDIGRLVFASSSSVYGACQEAPFVEDQDTTKPVSVYAATKRMGELLLHTYAHLWGLQSVSLRFFTVYGPAQRPDLAIHKFTHRLFNNLPIPVYGDGSAERDFTYIDDIVQGVLAALVYDQTPYEIVNLGESQRISVKALIERLEVLTGKTATIDWQPPVPGDVPMTCANIDKARRLLGYNPTVPLDIGLPRFVEWYRGFHGGDGLDRPLNLGAITAATSN